MEKLTYRDIEIIKHASTFYLTFNSLTQLFGLSNKKMRSIIKQLNKKNDNDTITEKLYDLEFVLQVGNYIKTNRAVELYYWTQKLTPDIKVNECKSGRR